MIAKSINIDQQIFPCINHSIRENTTLSLEQSKVIIKLLKRFSIPDIAILDFFKLLNIEEVEGSAIRVLIHEYPPIGDILTCSEIRRAFKVGRDNCSELKCPFKNFKSESTLINNLKYPVEHLKLFKELKAGTRLKNDNFVPIIKTVWYLMISTIITKKELKLGQIHTDGRIFAIMPVKSGNGKKEIIRTIKVIQGNIGKNVEEPTSLHPEQLVGKVVIRKSGEKDLPNKRKGYLSRDFVIVDEARELLTSNIPKYSESRKYLRLAMDAYPDNEITKKHVDIKFKDALRYKPYCLVCVFVQPYSFNEDFATDGDLRRYIVPYVNTNNIPNFEDFEDRVTDKNNSNESLTDFSEFLKSIIVPKKFIIANDAMEAFIELHKSLVKYGLLYSEKVRNFMDIEKFTLQDTLLKFCAIQALQNNTKIEICKISVKDVELAFVDLFELLNHQFRFIEELINGRMDYGQNWAGARGKDLEALNWLYESGATSEEKSNFTIANYVEEIKKIFNVKERSASEIKKRHFNRNWIKTKKGRGISKVWLNFTPKTGCAQKAEIDALPAPSATEKYYEIINYPKK